MHILKPIRHLLQSKCLEIFDHFFGLIGSTWPPYEQAKNSFGKYFDFAETFDRKVRKSGVGIFNDLRIPDFSIDFHIIKLLLLDMLTDDPITLLYLSL